MPSEAGEKRAQRAFLTDATHPGALVNLSRRYMANLGDCVGFRLQSYLHELTTMFRCVLKQFRTQKLREGAKPSTPFCMPKISTMFLWHVQNIAPLFCPLRELMLWRLVGQELDAFASGTRVGRAEKRLSS